MRSSASLNTVTLLLSTRTVRENFIVPTTSVAPLISAHRVWTVSCHMVDYVCCMFTVMKKRKSWRRHPVALGDLKAAHEPGTLVETRSTLVLVLRLVPHTNCVCGKCECLWLPTPAARRPSLVFISNPSMDTVGKALRGPHKTLFLLTSSMLHSRWPYQWMWTNSTSPTTKLFQQF